MYNISDPYAKKADRLTKAVKDEGRPTCKKGFFVHGNIFFILAIQFPETIDPMTQPGIRKLVPPRLNVCKIREDDPEIEPHVGYETSKTTTTSKQSPSRLRRGTSQFGGGKLGAFRPIYRVMNSKEKMSTEAAYRWHNGDKYKAYDAITGTHTEIDAETSNPGGMFKMRHKEAIVVYKEIDVKANEVRWETVEAYTEIHTKKQRATEKEEDPEESRRKEARSDVSFNSRGM